MELTKQDLQELLALFKSGYISMRQYEGALAEKRWTTSTRQAKEKFLSDGNQFNENDASELNHQVEKAKVCQFDWQQKVKNAFKSTTEFQRSVFVLFTGVLIGGVLFSGSPSLKTQNMDDLFVRTVNTIEQKAVQSKSDSDKDSLYQLVNALGRITDMYDHSKLAKAELVKGCISGVKESGLTPSQKSNRIKDCIDLVKE